MEHLWAFMAVVEEGMETAPKKEVFVLFADVSKAYDQVWRDGLYLLLYSYGIRGQMWTLIQKWLDGACAVTEWNGVRGPEVPLRQGLRQGCVLSPILYCIFVNAFLGEAPTTPSPPGMKAPLRAMFEQGLQDIQTSRLAGIQDPGIHTAGVGRVRSMLYMDDTALVASTLAGLEILLEKYQRFCTKFRIALNPKKSAVMRFSHGTPTPVEITSGGVTIKTPELGVYKYLGFWVDSQLKGDVHAKRALAIGRGKKHTVASIAKRMGEDLAVWYVKAKVVPKMTFGLELVPAWGAALEKKADSVLGDLLQEALMVGPITKWWERSQPWVKRDALHVEAGILQISSIVEQRKLGLANNIASDITSLAGSLFHAKCHGKGHNNPWLSSAVNLSTSALGTQSRTMGAIGHKAKVTMKDNIKKHIWTKQRATNIGNMPLREPDASGRQANTIYMDGMAARVKDSRSDPTMVEDWKEWVPNFSARVFLRRLRMGSIPGLKANKIKRCSNTDPVHTMTQSEKKQWLQCPCGRGNQDAVHFFRECAQADAARIYRGGAQNNPSLTNNGRRRPCGMG